MFGSLEEFQKKYLPKAYDERRQRELIKGGRYLGLVEYLVENNVELNLELISGMGSGDLGEILAGVSVGKMEKELCL